MMTLLASPRHSLLLLSLLLVLISPQLHAQGIAPAPGSEPLRPAPSAAHKPTLVPSAEAARAAEPTEDGLDLYFIGKRRSTLEPCGCATKQQGGVQLEASIYLQAPTTRPVLRVDAGEFTNPLAQRIPLESMKTRYLLRAMSQLGMDAINVSISDIQAPAAFYESIGVQHPQSLEPLVSATIFKKSDPDVRAFPQWRIVERNLLGGHTVKIGVTGATALRAQIPIQGMSVSSDAAQVETADYIAKAPTEALKSVIDELRGQVDLVVLLYAGDYESTFKLAQDFPQIDVIISTAPSMDRNAIFYREGPVSVMLTPAVQGKELGRATLLKQPDGRWSKQGEPEILLVSRELPYAPELQNVIEEFKKETQSLQAMAPPNAERLFAGAESCQQCHQDQYRQWMGTTHAKAMPTLVDIGQQFNPECVSCHVTGYNKGNGFYSLADGGSQMMMNVQCEVCHGPSLEHVHVSQKLLGAEQWMKPAQIELLKKDAEKSKPRKHAGPEVCTQCHTEVTDPEFSYDKKVVWIDHSRPFQRDEAKQKSKLKMIPMGGTKTTSDTLKSVHQ